MAMNRRTQLGLALTAVAALIGALVGLYVGFRLGDAIGNHVGYVITGAYLGLLVGPGLVVWAALALARLSHAGRTAVSLTLGWALTATTLVYTIPWLGTPQRIPGVLVLLVAASLVARLWAERPARSAHHRSG